jgi:YTH domain-containing family protein
MIWACACLRCCQGGRWRGSFGVEWLLVKDVPNAALRHLTLPNCGGRPLPASRDTQEVPAAQVS